MNILEFKCEFYCSPLAGEGGQGSTWTVEPMGKIMLRLRMCQTIPAFHSTICHAMVLSQAQEQVYYIYLACSVFFILMNLVI